MFEKLKPAIVLTSICLVVALLLSGINLITSPIIAERANASANAALLEVLPDGTKFDEVNLADYPTVPTAVTNAWRAPEGCVFKTVTKGYATGLTLMIGIDNEGKIVNTKVIAANETYGFEGKLDGQYNGDTIDSVGLIIAAGASPNSMTSKGYYDGVLSALQAFAMLGGQEVDTRTPDEIFRDNLNIALGTEGKKLTRWFATELLTDVDGVYVTDSADDGIVMLIGERLVALKNGVATVSLGAYDKDGVTTDATAEEKATAEAAYALYSTTSTTEIAKPDGTKATVQKIYKTVSGNYVIELITEGSYYSEAEYGGKEFGEPGDDIHLTVSITRDGRIIDVVTTKQSESKNYGDGCAKESFYASIRGTDREAILDLGFVNIIPDDYDDQIPATATGPAVIAGATFTTVYYQQALLDAFDVVLALEASN